MLIKRILLTAFFALSIAACASADDEGGGGGAPDASRSVSADARPQADARRTVDARPFSDAPTFPDGGLLDGDGGFLPGFCESNADCANPAQCCAIFICQDGERDDMLDFCSIF